MRATDLFHVGIVADDFEATLSQLTATLGYEWCPEMGACIPVHLSSGVEMLDLRFAYSRSEPRLEIVRRVPGSLWEPAAGSGIHHLGYWSDDLERDASALESTGMTREAVGKDEGGALKWSYHRGTTGPRIEMISTAVRPFMEKYWVS